MHKPVTIRTASPEETGSLGERLGSLLVAGDLVSLRGDLGSGKTVLVGGICASLGCAERVKSPSFVLVREYRGRAPVFHIDLYRLNGPEEWDGLGIDDRMEEAITLVEWGDRLGEILPPSALEVAIELGEGERDRLFSLSWRDPRIERLGGGQ